MKEARSMSEEQAAVSPSRSRKTIRRRQERKTEKPKQQPRYHVVLWNDDDHTYDYVIAMMPKLFAPSGGEGLTDCQGGGHARPGIVLTTTKEHAELKRDQIHAYGKDRDMQSCKGSMSASIEPER